MEKMSQSVNGGNEQAKLSETPLPEGELRSASDAGLERRGLDGLNGTAFPPPSYEARLKRQSSQSEEKALPDDAASHGLSDEDREFLRGSKITPMSGGSGPVLTEETIPGVGDVQDESPDQTVAREALPETERVKLLDENLTRAREKLARLEKLFGDKSILRTEDHKRLVEAQEEFVRAEAEVKIDRIKKQVTREAEVMREKEIAARGEGMFEKVRTGYKWLAEKNLGNLAGEGTWKRKLGRFANLRTGISAALVGLAHFVPSTLIAARGIRGTLTGIGTAYGVYDIQRRFSEGKLADISKLEDMSPEEVAKKLHSLVAFAHMKGTWQGLETSFDKVRAKYEEQMQWAAALGVDLVKYNDTLAVETQEKAWQDEDKRKQRAVLAGVGMGTLSFFGLAGLRRAGEFFGLESVEAATPSAEAVSGTKSFNELLTGVQEEKRTAFLSVSEKVRDAIETRDVLKGGSAFSIEFQPGEGPLQEARKAVAYFISEKDAYNMTRGERLWFEKRIWEVTEERMKTAGTLKNVWHPGDKVEFDKSAMASVWQEMKTRFPTPEAVESLNEKMRPAINNVNWNRYVTAGGYGAWEGDHGVAYKVPGISASQGAIELPPRETVGPNYYAESPSEVPAGRVAEATSGDYVISSEDLQAMLNEEDDPIIKALREAGKQTALNPELGLQEHLVTDELIADEEDMPFRLMELRPEEWSADQVKQLEKISAWLVENRSSLPHEQFEAVKTMPIGELVRQGFFSNWPEGAGKSHVEIMRLLKLRDEARVALNLLPPGDRAEVAQLSVHDFVKKILLASAETQSPAAKLSGAARAFAEGTFEDDAESLNTK